LSKEAEKSDEKLVRKEFEVLITAVIEACLQLGYRHTIFECERILTKMKLGKAVDIDNVK
jgi:hypothetical protein